MVGKAGLIISLIAAIINYGTIQPLFFRLYDSDKGRKRG
jgi:hypothetical protein